MPPGPFAALDPTVIVGEDRIVIAARRVMAEDALAIAGQAEGRWKPTGEFETMADRLPADLIFLNVTDTGETLPLLIAGLPMIAQQVNAAIAQGQAEARRNAGAAPEPEPVFQIRVDPALVPAPTELQQRLFPSSVAVAVDRDGLHVVTREPLPSLTSPAPAGVAVALLLPAVQAAREAARRAQCVNNLKQIGLALHNYHAANDDFPGRPITDKDGKPLLSWRVAILPYIEQEALYNQFKLDEPWDSPHNKALIAADAHDLRLPEPPAAEPGMTNYRVFVGRGAPCSTTRRARGSQDVTDGTSNTI